MIAAIEVLQLDENPDEYTDAAEPQFQCGVSHLSGMKSQPAFMPRKPLDNEIRHVRLMRQASTMLAWGMPLMP